MSEVTDLTQDTDVEETERDALERQAVQLGIKFHPNIGTDKLREKVSQALNSDGSDDDEEDVVVTVTPKAQKPVSRDDALALIRVRITCMNPNKKEWEGEVFTVGNSRIGTVRRMVPFEAEYHVPRIMLNMIRNRQYQTFIQKKLPNGDKYKEGKLVREFAIEELAPLTSKELNDLRQRQAMASGSND